MSILISGVAGFIGSKLARYFVGQGRIVLGVDNLCRGSLDNISDLAANKLFTFEKLNMTDFEVYRKAVSNFHERFPIEEVWHLAANSDIPAGIDDPLVDLQDTFMSTFNTLRLMRSLKVGVIAFASSSAVYGDLGDIPLSEDVGPLLPVSNYGAMKLASEAAISAATEIYLDNAYIFRFPNVVGTPATHGVILDFINKLKSNPNVLDVLGDGTQKKVYLHVDDLIEAMLFARIHSQDKLSFYNIGGGDEGVTVKYIAEETVAVVSPNAVIRYGCGNKGWAGDVPKFIYSVDKLRRLGWSKKISSKEAVLKAIREISMQVNDTQ